MNTQGTYVGDTGAVITLDCGTDVRAATARNIEARVRNSLGKLGPSVFIAHTVGGAASINTPEIAPEAATEIDVANRLAPQ